MMPPVTQGAGALASGDFSLTPAWQLLAFGVTPHWIWREGAWLIKDKLIRSRSRAATPIGCVRPNICIRVIGLLGLEASTKPGGDSLGANHC